jgi:hypothetical protein
MLLRRRDGRDAAIDDHRNTGQRSLEPINTIIVERRDIAVFLRRQSIQPRLTRMNHQCVRACSNHRAAQRIKRHFRILIVDTDAALYRDRNFDGLLHRRNAFSHELRLRHQARAEPAVLHAIRRTADIEIDLIVAETFSDTCALGEIARVRATELKRNGCSLASKPSSR